MHDCVEFSQILSHMLTSKIKYKRPGTSDCTSDSIICCIVSNPVIELIITSSSRAGGETVGQKNHSNLQLFMLLLRPN